jgi:HEPN domain-containing protein
MKPASRQWLESAEMDLGSIEHIPFEVDRGILTDLDDLYIESRYPGALGLLPNGRPTREDAERFYRFAQNLYQQIGRTLEAGR